MLISEFDYELPPELIAQEPLADRAGSRMLAVDRRSGDFSDEEFTVFPQFLHSGDVLVLNNTKVFPARLFGRTDSGANVEIFLVAGRGETWEALARPARRLRAGKEIVFSDKLIGEVTEKAGDGKLLLRFKAQGDLDAIIDAIGKTPLPPYIKRAASSIDTDRERYQTVFATNRGAIAAPTAGLHFTPQLTAALHAPRDGTAAALPPGAHRCEHRVRPIGVRGGERAAQCVQHAKGDAVPYSSGDTRGCQAVRKGSEGAGGIGHQDFSAM